MVPPLVVGGVPSGPDPKMPAVEHNLLVFFVVTVLVLWGLGLVIRCSHTINLRRALERGQVARIRGISHFASIYSQMPHSHLNAIIRTRQASTPKRIPMLRLPVFMNLPSLEVFTNAEVDGYGCSFQFVCTGQCFVQVLWDCDFDYLKGRLSQKRRSGSGFGALQNEPVQQLARPNHNALSHLTNTTDTILTTSAIDLESGVVNGEQKDPEMLSVAAEFQVAEIQTEHHSREPTRSQLTTPLKQQGIQDPQYTPQVLPDYICLSSSHPYGAGSQVFRSSRDEWFTNPHASLLRWGNLERPNSDQDSRAKPIRRCPLVISFRVEDHPGIEELILIFDLFTTPENKDGDAAAPELSSEPSASMPSRLIPRLSKQLCKVSPDRNNPGAPSIYVVEEIYGLDDANSPECVICLTDPKDITLLPCRHVCVCQECSKHIDRCPVCRSPFDNYMCFDRQSKMHNLQKV